MIPKGKLLIIGGAEDIGEASRKYKKDGLERFEILKELLPKSKKRKIEIITTGSTMQEQVRRRYHNAFHRMGYLNPGFIPIKDKIEAKEKAYLDRVRKAAAVFFTGGDQFRIATILGGTKLVEIIRRRYNTDKNFLVAGTSAGAMVMSEIMIAGGGIKEALFDRDLKISSGLGFLKNCIIDTHFIKRGRFGRLAHAVVINSYELGIGLGEDTALIIKQGSEAECRGSGMVIIIDGKYIRQTNISLVKKNIPLYVENLKVHILVRGCKFSIKTRKLYKPTKPKETLRDDEQ